MSLNYKRISVMLVGVGKLLMVLRYFLYGCTLFGVILNFANFMVSVSNINLFGLSIISLCS